MARRSRKVSLKGQVYAIEWPEWFVECGHPGCARDIDIVAPGQVTTVREAEKRLRHQCTETASAGWRKRGLRWYCPDHATKSAKGETH